jgi:6-phospho-3-hexuloisomerase
MTVSELTTGVQPAAFGARLSGAVQNVLAENRQVLTHIEADRVQAFIAALCSAGRVFFTGEGRSGLVARMAAMRLLHLGLQVHVVGETTTPVLGQGDCLVAVSGSGGTGQVAHLAERASSAGGRILVVTAVRDSPLTRNAAAVITIPAAAKTDRSLRASVQFAGSLFEQSALLLFDAIFHLLADDLGRTVEELWAGHTNLE